MSYEGIDWAYEQGEKHDLNASEMCVLAYLCRRMEKDTGEAWPSNALIALECRVGTERTVTRILSSLRNKGLIEGDRRGSRGRGEGLKKYQIPGALRAEREAKRKKQEAANPTPVSGLNPTPVSDRRVKGKDKFSETHRVSSRFASESTKTKPSQAKIRRDAEKAEAAIDSGQAVWDGMDEGPEIPEHPETAYELAVKFRHSLNEDFAKGSHMATVAMFRSWMKEIPVDLLSEMIDIYAANPESKGGELPHQAFANRRGKILHAVKKRREHLAYEDGSHWQAKPVEEVDYLESLRDPVTGKFPESIRESLRSQGIDVD